MIKTRPTLANRSSVGVVEVPDGQWVVEHVYWERHYGSHGGRPNAPDLRDAEVIGLGDRVPQYHCTSGSSYRNGGGGMSGIEFRAIVSSHPFAVVQHHTVGADYVFASVTSARQIHKGELGHYPMLPGLPDVVCRRSYGNGKEREFVKWSEVAATYGETDLRQLWRTFMPFRPPSNDFLVTYEEAQNVGQVHYPRSFNGTPSAYYSDAFRTGFTEERIEAVIASRNRPDPEADDCLRARMKDLRERLQIEHEQHVKKVCARQWVIGHVLWDDPVLQLEHLCVPVAFARSVLICKRFGYVPDFAELMAAVARHEAMNKVS